MNIRKGLKVACGVFAINPPAFYNNLRGIPAFFKDWGEIRKQRRSEAAADFALRMNYPCLGDRYDSAGKMSGHYFHQDLHVSQRIFRANPVRHIDIGSRIDGFVAHVAAFREIEVFDIREVQSTSPNIRFRCADLMRMPEGMENYCDSISSLHAIEHFGLGRYGDPIDWNGHLKALRNITKILRGGGTFYFSVPVGPQRIEFNAHRVFAIKYLLALFEKDYELRQFSYVDDAGDFHENVRLTENAVAENFGCVYGCGLFELYKRP
ncbi:MAG: DUF268 domain-containing protein [Tannerella sp.]|jgi:SAM-dependent methyltransferase|nr:DUF268 domain-containing protein [Tannerella sp.]